MTRPGFVLEIGPKSPPLLTLAGAYPRLTRFSPGTQVVYPAEATASTDPVGLIQHALAAPLESEPLANLLQPETKLAVVVVDEGTPLPAARFDARRNMIELVLETAARAGVADVHIVTTAGLRPRWSPARVGQVLGDRVAMSFLPDELIASHDVTAADLVSVGSVEGHEVRINAQVAAADVVVSIGLQTGPGYSDCSWLGLCDDETINACRGLGATAARRAAVQELVLAGRRHFHLQATLGQPLFTHGMNFLSRREWRWQAGSQANFATIRQLAALLPDSAQGRLVSTLADYAVLDVAAGHPTPVLTQAQQVWRTANAVAIQPTADVVVSSAWGQEIDAAYAIGSPIGAAHQVLVEQVTSHEAGSFGRKDCVVIGFHPLTRNDANRARVPSDDFLNTVLPETLEPQQIKDSHEATAMHDTWYRKLYRDHGAFHPLHVFHQWYAIAQASTTIAELIWVAADRGVAEKLGHRVASTYLDALEIAADKVGRSPQITYLHSPGRAVGVTP
ncbi:MAG: hypothetical protein CSA64_03005 [Arachnia propionica]|nr:MAG: hypothetical protein CSA64_03005 [Arachnia propionica]